MHIKGIEFDRNNPVCAFAAEEWQRYSERITGRPAAPNGEPATAGTLILSVIGDEFFDSLPEQVHELSQDIRDDGFLCGLIDGNVYAVAGKSRGVLFAVYDLLEKEGGAVFGGPHDGEEFIPSKAAIDVERTAAVYHPTIPLRIVGFHNETAESDPECPFDWVRMLDWMAKRKFSGFQASWSPYLERRDRLLSEIRKRGLVVEVGNHSAFHLLPPDTYRESHPDFFSKDAEGRLVGGNLCFSNAAMREELARQMVSTSERYPEIGILDLWAPDGALPCQCVGCQAHPPARWLYETSASVAGRLAKARPGVAITHLAYDFFTAPPEDVEPLPDNVFIQFCDYWSRIQNKPVFDYRQGHRALMPPDVVRRTRESGRYHRDHRDVCEEIAAWCRVSARPGLFTYYSDLVIKRLITNVTDAMRRDMAYFEALGIRAFSDCLCRPQRWINHALTLFALGEFGWDRRTTVADVVTRFARGMFGRGTEERVASYYAKLAELQNEPCLLGFNVIDLLHRDPREIAHFAGVIEALVRPTREAFETLLGQLDADVAAIRGVPDVNRLAVDEVERATLHLRLILRENLAFYLAYAYEEGGNREQALAELDNAQRFLEERVAGAEPGQRFQPTTKRDEGKRKAMQALREKVSAAKVVITAEESTNSLQSRCCRPR